MWKMLENRMVRKMVGCGGKVALRESQFVIFILFCYRDETKGESDG